MTHPDELLAGYVDGTLSPAERAAVDTHVSGCDRCRHEIALAAAALAALTALPEVPAPAGVGDRALAEAGVARTASASAGSPRWYRIAGIAAAVAAVALVLVVVLPDPEGGDRTTLSADTAAGAEAGGGAAAPEGAASTIEVRDADYTAEDLGGLLAPYQRDMALGGAAIQGRAGTDAETQRALGCLNTAAPDAGTGLVQLIQARFGGEPAFFAIFLEGPGAGQPNDKGTVWVVSRRDCTILSFAQAKL